MANNITGNPWYVDTVGTIFSLRFKFDGGVWSPEAPGLFLTLTDITGRFVFNSKADTVGANVDIPRMGWINGLVCTVIGGGNVIIYVGNK